MKPEYERAYSAFIIIGIATLSANLWYYAYPMWERIGFTHPVAVTVFLRLRLGGFFDTPLLTKCLALLLSMMTVFSRHGRRNSLGWPAIAVAGATGLVLYLAPFRDCAVYVAASLAGHLVTITAAALAFYKLSGGIKPENDLRETFEQCGELVDTPNSVNLPTRYKYKGKEHRGWINIVNPFRGTLVLGTPGSGKSYSVYLPMMEQMMRKGYTLFVYDYKYPSLTFDAYNVIGLRVA